MICEAKPSVQSIINRGVAAEINRTICVICAICGCLITSETWIIYIRYSSKGAWNGKSTRVRKHLPARRNRRWRSSAHHPAGEWLYWLGQAWRSPYGCLCPRPIADSISLGAPQRAHPHTPRPMHSPERHGADYLWISGVGCEARKRDGNGEKLRR